MEGQDQKVDAEQLMGRAVGSPSEALEQLPMSDALYLSGRVWGARAQRVARTLRGSIEWGETGGKSALASAMQPS